MTGKNLWGSIDFRFEDGTRFTLGLMDGVKLASRLIEDGYVVGESEEWMGVRESEDLSRLVADFAEAMRQKLWRKLREGYRGWDDDSDREHVVENLRTNLKDHVRRYEAGEPGQIVDIANLTAMLWRFEVKGAKVVEGGSGS